jgi:hypothetical protein
MNGTELYERLATLLDESTSQYFTDDERWAALTDGQQEYASTILTQYKARVLINPSESIPEVLRTLYKSLASSTSNSYIALPNDFLYDVSLLLGDQFLLKRELSRIIPAEQANSLLGASGYYYSISSLINLEITTPSSPVSFIFNYLQKPTDITQDVNPILPDFTHYPIVIYAYAELLKKSQRLQEALVQYQQFLQLIKYL